MTTKVYDKRQGALGIFSTLDGGEISSINGEPVMDHGLESACYLSLTGPPDNDYWANEYLTPSRQIRSRFQEYAKRRALTSATIVGCEEQVRLDLQWLIDEGVADEINVSARSISRNKVAIDVEVLADRKRILKNAFLLNWEAQRDFPLTPRV